MESAGGPVRMHAACMVGECLLCSNGAVLGLGGCHLFTWCKHDPAAGSVPCAGDRRSTGVPGRVTLQDILKFTPLSRQGVDDAGLACMCSMHGDPCVTRSGYARVGFGSEAWARHEIRAAIRVVTVLVGSAAAAPGCLCGV